MIRRSGYLGKMVVNSAQLELVGCSELIGVLCNHKFLPTTCRGLEAVSVGRYRISAFVNACQGLHTCIPDAKALTRVNSMLGPFNSMIKRFSGFLHLPK